MKILDIKVFSKVNKCETFDRVIKSNCNFSAHLLSLETLSFEIFSSFAAHDNIAPTPGIAVIYKTYTYVSGQLKICI